jgi:putative Holliday junction resolvase
VRTLGVDYGEKRIGLAISDPLGIFAQPHSVVDGTDARAAARRIAEISREREVETIVVGLPRNMNDTLGPKAIEALAFKELLEKETGLEVVTWDERLSTARAQRALRESSMSRKKRQQRVDAVAAQVVLQAYLDSKNRQAKADEKSGGESPS